MALQLRESRRTGSSIAGQHIRKAILTDDGIQGKGRPRTGSADTPPTSASRRSPLISSKAIFGQRVGLATIPCYSPKKQGRGFCTSIHVVRVSTKLLKILIAALSPSVAY